MLIVQSLFRFSVCRDTVRPCAFFTVVRKDYIVGNVERPTTRSSLTYTSLSFFNITGSIQRKCILCRLALVTINLDGKCT